MRLIDADRLYEMIPQADLDHDEKISKCGAIADFTTIVSKAPTVDPVKHAHWIPLWRDDGNGNYLFLCPNCQHSDWHSRAAQVNYCWNCGAKMDEVTDDINTDDPHRV